MGFGKVGREKFHPFYGSSPDRSSTRRGGGFPFCSFSSADRYPKESDFYRPTPLLHRQGTISPSGIWIIAFANLLLSIGNRFNAYSCIEMEMREERNVCRVFFLCLYFSFFLIFIRLIRKIGQGWSKAGTQVLISIGRLRFNYRAFDMFQKGDDYQNPSSLLIYLCLSWIFKVILLFLPSSIVRRFIGEFFLFSFPRGDCKRRCSNVDTGTAVCVHCIHRGIGFWNDSLVGGRCFLSCSFSSCSVRGRKIRGTNARWEDASREGEEGRRGGCVPRTAWAASRSFRRESFVVKVAVHSRGDEKILPPQLSCVFLHLSSRWPRYFPRRSFFPATGKPTDRCRKLRESHPRRSIRRSDIRWSFFRFLERDHVTRGFRLTFCLLYIWQDVPASFLSIGKDFRRFKFTRKLEKMEITIDCIIFCINNINKFTLITSAFVFSAWKEERASSFPPPRAFSNLFSKKGQRYFRRFRFLSISLTFTLPRINSPHPRGRSS